MNTTFNISMCRQYFSTSMWAGTPCDLHFLVTVDQHRREQSRNEFAINKTWIRQHFEVDLPQANDRYMCCLQMLLRRSKYDFATANAALLACGAKISERYVKQAKGKPGADERPAKRQCMAPALDSRDCAMAAEAKSHAMPSVEPPHASDQAQGAEAAANGEVGSHLSSAQGQAAVAGALAGAPEAPVQPGSSASGHGSLALGEAAAAGAPVEAPAPALQPNGGAHGGAAAMEVDSGAGERNGAMQQAPASGGDLQYAPAGDGDAEAALLYCAARSARYILHCLDDTTVHCRIVCVNLPSRLGHTHWPQAVPCKICRGYIRRYHWAKPSAKVQLQCSTCRFPLCKHISSRKACIQDRRGLFAGLKLRRHTWRASCAHRRRGGWTCAASSTWRR